MYYLLAIYLIFVNVCAYSLPTISTENVVQRNRSCDVTLNFSNMDLTIINPNFISNLYVKTLALRNNSIRHFQENTFDSLPSLETLDLSNNELSAENLFSFGNLYALKSLTLDRNPKYLSMIRNRPVTIYDRIDRGDIDIGTTPVPPSYARRRQHYTTEATSTTYHNYTTTGSYSSTCGEDQYKTPDGMCNFYSELEVKYEYPNLTHLSIRKTLINSLANDWASHFPQLTHLDISENDFFMTSAEVIRRLPATLVSLTMRNVRLTTLESSILENIKHLDLSENYFDTLSIRHCYQNTFCLRNLVNLISLHIAKCSIRKIETDAFKNAEGLTYLDMSYNDFEEISDETFEFLSALSHLDISGSKLLVIPDFSKLQNLTSLYMDNMQYQEPLSPSALSRFSQLPRLEILSLRSNGLTTIPASFLNNLPNLSKLNLSYNRISSLPSWQWQNKLHSLLLDNNEIENLEDIFLIEADSLKLLNLKDNKFTEIKLKSLKHLPDDVILKL